MRKALALAALAGLVVLSGCGTKDAGSGSTTTATSTVARPSVAADAATLGPAGFGGFTLGATAEQVKAAGLELLPDTQGYQNCPQHAELKRPNGFGDVLISSRNGVSVIVAGDDMHTPEGIRVGSSLDEVTKAYPQLANDTKDPNFNGENATPVPGNARAAYRIFIINGKVTALDLHLTGNDCVN